MFKEKTVEEVAAMSHEEQIKYFNDLNAHKAQQLAEYKAELEKETSEEIESKIKALKEEMAADNIEQLKAINESIKAQGLAIAKLSKGDSKDSKKTILDILTENKDAIKSVADKNSPTIKFVIDKTEITTSAVTTPYQGMQIPGAGMMPHQGAVLRPIFPQVTLAKGSNGTVYYTDQTTDTNNAAGTSESGSFKESAAAWTGRSFTVDKITDSLPVTWEALRDFNFMEGEIRRLLDTHIRIKEDNYLWDGSGSAPIAKGMYTYASAFDSSSYSGYKPEKASIFDLIAIMKVEISNGYGGMYQPNVVVLNPADVLRMKLNKDDNGQYVIPPYTMSNGQVVDGLKVIESESVTANTLCVADSRFGTIYDDGGIEIEIGVVNTQFTEDVVTLKARKRMGLLIRTAYTGAFLKSTDIKSDVSNITAGV